MAHDRHVTEVGTADSSGTRGDAGRPGAAGHRGKGRTGIAERAQAVVRSVRERFARQPDRDALLIWFASRASIFVVAWAIGWLVASDQDRAWRDRWAQWDFVHFQGIAEFGYGGEPTGVPNEAFFPGLPVLLSLGNTIGLPYPLAGLLISLLAGGVAAVALARLGDLEGGPGTGRLAVLVWVTAPPAIFLAAPYTEALFLAFAIPAWLAVRRGDWAAAGALAAAACTVRVSGVFLAAALVVAWLTSRRRSWSDVGWLALPAIPLVGWMTYLWWLTGDSLAWLHAQAEEWNRTFTWPWDSFANTWNAAFGGLYGRDFAWMFATEIVALLLGIALTAGLLWWRRWGEATWVGLQVVAFSTSYWFFSVPRATLLWWPLWIGLAVLAARHRIVLWCYLAVSGPLMCMWAVAFLTGRWAG